MPPAGITFATLKTRLRALTDLDDTEAGARINQAYLRFARKSEAVRDQIVISGGTVVNQTSYTLPAEVVSLRTLRIDGKRYDRKSLDELLDLQASEAYTLGYPARFFAPDFETDGDAAIQVYPAPAEAGLVMAGRAAILPDYLTGSDIPKLPADFHEDLIEGAFAMGLGRDDEQFAERQALLAEFDQRARECGAAVRRRVGGGVHRIRLTR